MYSLNKIAQFQKSSVAKTVSPSITVTRSADFGFILLLRKPPGQGPQGCLEKQNYPLSWNLAVRCAKIGPKTQKLQKTLKMTRKTTKNGGFSTVF